MKCGCGGELSLYVPTLIIACKTCNKQWKPDFLEREIPKVDMNNSILKKQRVTVSHELSAVRGTLNLLLEDGVSDSTQQKALDYAKNKIDSILWVLSSEKVGNCYVPRYHLITYYETMYIIENADKNISIIKKYDEKRRKHHNEMLSYMGVERDSEDDKELQKYINENYFGWKERTLPHLGSMYNTMINRMKEEL